MIQFTIFKQITANKSFKISISSLVLAGINDICMWIEVIEICDCAEKYIGPESDLLLLVLKYDKQYPGEFIYSHYLKH